MKLKIGQASGTMQTFWIDEMNNKTCMFKKAHYFHVSVLDLIIEKVEIKN